MMKMLIRLDSAKIVSEAAYSENAIYSAIEGIFLKMGYTGKSEDAGVMYYGSDSPRDFGCFGRAVNTLKKQEWFLPNASAWVLYDNDCSDGSAPFEEEDLLEHYRGRHGIG